MDKNAKGMRKILLTLCVTALAAMTVSCKTSRDTVVPVDSLKGEWTITEVGGKATVATDDSAPFLGFDVKSGRLYGSAGCNRLMGAIEEGEAEGSISFGQVARTRMRCLDMTTERAVVEALENTVGYRMNDSGELLLLDGDGTVVMRLQKK